MTLAGRDTTGQRNSPHNVVRLPAIGYQLPATCSR
jgi:hypothetical protein